MKAAIYTRVSSDRQVEEGFSLEAQHDILMELLEKKGLELYRVYSDPGISAKTIKKRPGIKALIADMKAGRFDAILIHKLDRLSRNLGDIYQFIELINKLNKRLIIASLGSDEVDTNSPMGKAFLLFNGIFAEIYLDNLREETLKGLVKKISKGGRHMSRPPLGYDRDDDGDLTLNDAEAELVKEVYRLYLSGKGVNAIAKTMNEHSRGKEGGVWDSKYVRMVLTNYTYIGKNHFKPEDWPEEQRIIVNGDHDPIVSETDFYKVRKMMERKADGYMSKTSHEYPFGGILRCGCCGATYIGYSSTHKVKDGTRTYKSYRCRNNYANNTCDSPAISERLLVELIFKNLVITSNKIREKDSKQARKDIRRLQREIEISKKRRKNWRIAVGDGTFTAEEYAELIEEEDRRMKAIYAEYQEYDDPYVNDLSIDEIKNAMLNLKDNWNYLEAETQKQLIQSMFRQIIIKKESSTWNIIQILTA
ncbi:recombinase family protein [Paenibacillus melissococcoides]|uniref:Recombinase family protein n=1 Tax=Paenibacillus melissococcoides TaxID=2912268 RepID=A0ABN8UEL8_9BACL|nr:MULTISPECIES: recombinase family protein [Paenibacillus]MEB9896793.1 recombinase family protein [Bacillus cereus]CAH8248589.1 recombinase family protein [Paenibacillus melissococcoides]CAH8714318.1 recombinase family protein [Paenibacillus melissococcoides]CAH8719916.1 recombinase family protein [Paenibacillus melissococcoides]